MIVSNVKRDRLSYCNFQGFIFTKDLRCWRDLCEDRPLSIYGRVWIWFWSMNFRCARVIYFSWLLCRLFCTCGLFFCLSFCWWNCDIFCSLSCVFCCFIELELLLPFTFFLVDVRLTFCDCSFRHWGLCFLWFVKKRKLFKILFVWVVRWGRWRVDEVLYVYIFW